MPDRLRLYHGQCKAEAGATGELRIKTYQATVSALGEHERLLDWLTGLGEALSNACRHGGRRVDVQAWTDNGLVWWQVEDDGCQGSQRRMLLAIEAAKLRTELGQFQDHGYGLWLVSEVSETFRIFSGSHGTIVRACVRINE